MEIDVRISQAEAKAEQCNSRMARSLSQCPEKSQGGST